MRLKITAALICLALAGPAYASSFSLVVQGTSDPWLAGMSAGAVASSVDSAPSESPALVVGLNLEGGELLRFAAWGGVMNYAGCPETCDGPDGSYIVPHYAGAENGFSTVFAPLNSLLGVFLPATYPDVNATPDALDFSDAGLGRDFTTLSPELQQIFFIGNGLTSAAEVQEFIAPAGASRLFLGTMDGFEWLNNSGAFNVQVDLLQIQLTNAAEAPEPATLLLLGSGLLALRRRMTSQKAEGRRQK